MNNYLEALERIKRGQTSDDLYKIRHEDLEVIEETLKKHNELTSKPVLLCARTSRKEQILIDKICKNYKEVTVTNLESNKKLIAFDIIKEKRVDICMLFNCFERGGLERYNDFLDKVYLYLPRCHLAKEQFDFLDKVYLYLPRYHLTKEQFDLLKEVLTTDNECQKDK